MCYSLRSSETAPQQGPCSAKSHPASSTSAECGNAHDPRPFRHPPCCSIHPEVPVQMGVPHGPTHLDPRELNWEGEAAPNPVQCTVTTDKTETGPRTWGRASAQSSAPHMPVAGPPRDCHSQTGFPTRPLHVPRVVAITPPHTHKDNTCQAGRRARCQSRFLESEPRASPCTRGLSRVREKALGGGWAHLFLLGKAAQSNRPWEHKVCGPRPTAHSRKGKGGARGQTKLRQQGSLAPW